ncbi:hypothetical protein AJ80_06745 [Polytolypa hystricis UAMH7299]|uniref:Uncharacterized protein n=1 Tax=Polytolypa hystricis (strain UAMH7299) TaxID=1447883 RepID=A0A2B7XTR9_POLH7|nr:hypothetical protein AJ80_06745 [Polytolypa hystricis UAMH7299]
MTNLSLPDDDDAPPPYTPVDPLTPASSNTSSASGGVTATATATVTATPATVLTPPASDINTPTTSTTTEDIPAYTYIPESPANFITAGPYFLQRAQASSPPPPPPALTPAPLLITPPQSASTHSADDFLEHTLTIYSRSQSKDYPRPPRCWRTIPDEHLTQLDWNTFLNYVFPPHLAPAATQMNLPRKLRAEIERDHKDCAQESDVERRTRIAAVVAEWNHEFFAPRGLSVRHVYIGAGETAPPTPLCPMCYPSSVRTMVMRHAEQARSPAAREGSTARQGIPRRPVGAQPNQGYSAPMSVPPVEPDHAPTHWSETTTTTTTSSRSPSIPYPNDAVELESPTTPSSNLSFGGIASAVVAVQNWATQMHEQAHQYGQRVTEQAAAYGKRIEDQSQMCGQMIERQAKLHSDLAQHHAKRIEQMGQRACDGWSQTGHASMSWCPPRGGARGSQWCSPQFQAHMHARDAFWGARGRVRGRGRGCNSGFGIGMRDLHHQGSHQEQEMHELEAPGSSTLPAQAQQGCHAPRHRPRSPSVCSNGSSSSSASSLSEATDTSSDSDSDSDDNHSDSHSARNNHHDRRRRNPSDADMAYQASTRDHHARLLEHHAAAQQLRQEYRALKTAHQHIRKSEARGHKIRGRRGGGGGGGVEDDEYDDAAADIAAERAALKIQMQQMKADFHTLVHELKKEKREIRRVWKEQKKEENRARHEERKTRRQRGIGERGGRNGGGGVRREESRRTTDPPHPPLLQTHSLPHVDLQTPISPLTPVSSITSQPRSSTLPILPAVALPTPATLLLPKLPSSDAAAEPQPPLTRKQLKEKTKLQKAAEKERLKKLKRKEKEMKKQKQNSNKSKNKSKGKEEEKEEEGVVEWGWAEAAASTTSLSKKKGKDVGKGKGGLGGSGAWTGGGVQWSGDTEQQSGVVPVSDVSEVSEIGDIDGQERAGSVVS